MFECSYTETACYFESIFCEVYISKTIVRHNECNSRNNFLFFFNNIYPLLFRCSVYITSVHISFEIQNQFKLIFYKKNMTLFEMT